MNDNTIDYYNTHAVEFCAETVNANMQECRERFLQYLSPGQKILDAGCGSGRDVVAFLNAGYEVEAFDASPHICRIASQMTGIDVRCLRFEKLDGEAIYDGIWACASLLHVDRNDISDVLSRLHRLLNNNGILYASFKYGQGERLKEDRYFHDLTESECQQLVKDAGFKVKEIFITDDVREGRNNERWVNVIVQKKEG